MDLAPSVSDIIRVQGLVKTYGVPPAEMKALRGVDVGFAGNRLTVVMGPSGAGKSTLLYCMAGLVPVTSGTVTVDGKIVTQMSHKQLITYRRDTVGLIFPSFNLLPALTAEENIQLPLDIKKAKVDKAWRDQIVASLRLGDTLNRRPRDLSAGEQQRVACARALITKPSVVFADEPTGTLDSTLAQQGLESLLTCVRELGQTVIVASHDPVVASCADQVYFLQDGMMVDRLDSPTTDRVMSAMRSMASVRAGS